MIHWNCYRKSEAVAQLCSEKMMFCKIHNFHRKHLLWIPFWKNCKPTCLQLPYNRRHDWCFLVNSFGEYNFFGSFHSSIRSDMFYKVGLLKNFEKLTGKHLCRSFIFLMKLHHHACNFIKNPNFWCYLITEWIHISPRHLLILQYCTCT